METREQFWVTIVVEGTPVAKGRPVFGRGHVYTPAATRKFETDAGWMARAAMKGRPPLQGPLSMDLLINLGAPASWPAKCKAAALTGLVMPTGRPDRDNLQKAICDAFRRIVFLDDAQIVTSHARKRFGATPKLVATVSPLAGEGN
jgi:Holliday junction resolvase RusA-like endonuclease